LELITETTTYVPFCQAMVDTVSPLTESGSTHFPVRPGMACWAEAGWVEEVAIGAPVASGNGEAGNITGGNFADERVADGSGEGKAVGGGVVANCATVGLGVGKRELHEAMTAIPAKTPIDTSQNFPCISIYFLHFS
jgi:hypothetical protein